MATLPAATFRSVWALAKPGASVDGSTTHRLSNEAWAAIEPPRSPLARLIGCAPKSKVGPKSNTGNPRRSLAKRGHRSANQKNGR
jgi:hypothetical protein